MEYRNKRWKNRRPSQERITFQKVGDRTMPTEPPIRRVRYSSSSYNVSLTLDDGTITVSGKAKGAYTPSITGRMPKAGNWNWHIRSFHLQEKKIWMRLWMELKSQTYNRVA